MSRHLSVVVMTRAARPGQTKTRLQPLLGAAGCARLQHALITHTVATVANAAPTLVYVAVDPPDALPEVAELVGAATGVFTQEGEHLGVRMSAAIAHAARIRPGPVVLIGTDVPHLRAEHIVDAARLLEHGHDVVFGPALDGGYYLIALTRPTPDVFGIDPALWGGAGVLDASVAAARDAGLRIGFLPPLRDLDTAEDGRALADDDTVPAEIRSILIGSATTAHTQLADRPLERVLAVSIIVPVLNEAAIIDAALARLRRDFGDCELLVVDGGSSDATAQLASTHAPVLSTGPGRAVQMNEGARHAGGDVLWFVHADTAIDPSAVAQLRAALADPDIVGGGLSLRFDRRTSALDYLARVSTLRARRLHHVFGDQAMFVRREVFERLGGFAPLPLMEDFEFSRRLHRAGRMVVLPATSTASSRRFTRHGTVRMIAFMQYLKLLFLAGASPERIRLRYEAGPGIALPRLTVTTPARRQTPASRSAIQETPHGR